MGFCVVLSHFPSLGGAAVPPDKYMSDGDGPLLIIHGEDTLRAEIRPTGNHRSEPLVVSIEHAP